MASIILPIILLVIFFLVMGLIIWFARKSSKGLNKSRPMNKMSKRELKRMARMQINTVGGKRI